MVLPKFFQRIFNNERTKHLGNIDKPNQCNCKVVLLNEQELELDVKPSVKGQVVLDKVFDFINLIEREYFGLRYIDSSDQQHWLDVKKSVQSQLKVSPYRFYFGVKFYASDPCKLQEEITRYQFFLQVKQDVVLGRLPVSSTVACELAAFVLQSEIGNYDSKRHLEGYVSEFSLVPHQTKEMENLIARCHRKLIDVKPASAEMTYLNTVKWLDFYGVDMHNVQGKHNADYQLGLAPLGIKVYKGKEAIGKFLWPRIVKVTRKNCTFNVRVQDNKNEETVHVFECPTKAACKHLWTCCIEHHQFYRLSAKMASYNTRLMSREFRKVRKSASGEVQRSGSSSNRVQPVVVRTPSKKHQRTQSVDSLPNILPSPAIPSCDETSSAIVISASDKYTRHDGYSSAPEASSKNAPWESGNRRGLFTSGRSSPDSAYRERLMFPGQQQFSDVESEPSRRGRRRGREDCESDGDSRSRRRSRSSRCPADESATESEASYVFRRRKRRSTDSVPQTIDRDGNLGSLTSIVSEASQKRRQRKRSRSPGHKPPSELAQHFRYIDPTEAGISEQQLRDIEFTSVVTEVDKPKVRYPNHRQRSPKRQNPSDVDENIEINQHDMLERDKFNRESLQMPSAAAEQRDSSPVRTAKATVISTSQKHQLVPADYTQPTGLVCIQPVHCHVSQAVHKVKTKPSQDASYLIPREQMNWTASSHQREDSGISDAGSAFVNGNGGLHDYKNYNLSSVRVPVAVMKDTRVVTRSRGPVASAIAFSPPSTISSVHREDAVVPPAPQRTVSLYGGQVDKHQPQFRYHNTNSERTADV